MPSYRGLLEKRILFTLAVFPGAAQSFFLLFQLALYFYFQICVVHVLVRLLKHAPIHPRINRFTDNRKCNYAHQLLMDIWQHFLMFYFNTTMQFPASTRCFLNFYLAAKVNTASTVMLLVNDDTRNWTSRHRSQKHGVKVSINWTWPHCLSVRETLFDPFFHV